MSDAISDDEIDPATIFIMSITASESYLHDSQNRLYGYTNSWNIELSELYSYDAVCNEFTLKERNEPLKVLSYAEDNRLTSIAQPPAINEDFEDNAADDWVKTSETWKIEMNDALETRPYLDA